jgi:hypothetical protein
VTTDPDENVRAMYVLGMHASVLIAIKSTVIHTSTFRAHLFSSAGRGL